MNQKYRQLAKLDKKYTWHPFTQMSEWIKSDPIILTRAKGPHVFDVRGRRYLDANSSIWTNTHGHGHPRIRRAIEKQLRKLSHSSYLGQGNEPASLLAEKLVRLTRKLPRPLNRVFYSDDGSTALEVALKMSFQYWLQQKKEKPRRRFLALEGSYHGDTLGAVSLSHVPLFDGKFKPLLVKSDQVMAPSCYRCPFNRAKPARENAMLARRCNWECVALAEKKLKSRKYAAFVVEPAVQGVAGMVVHPPGYLARIARTARRTNTLLILDEVMTAFGRTGTMFACAQERVTPDLLCLAKGLTGGTMPLAATLTTERVFQAFLGEFHELKTFFHGHSYTGNPLGCAAALANLEIFEREGTFDRIRRLERVLARCLEPLWNLPHVGDIRQKGLVAGIELVKNWKTRGPYPWQERMGAKVCHLAKKKGVLTRPIGDVIVLMPPYCVTPRQIERICRVIYDAISLSTSALERKLARANENDRR